MINRDSPPASEQRRVWPWWLLAGAIVAVLTAGALVVVLRGPLAEFFGDRAKMQAYLDTQGARAPIVFMLLQAAQVLAAPIPGHLLAILAGALFGPWLGTAYTVAGVGAGSALALLLARLFGRPLVGRLVPRSQLARVDRWSLSRGPIFFFVVFLFPFLPDDLACFAAGLSPLPFWVLLGIIVTARLPGHFASAWLGATATRLPAAAWVALIVLAVLLTVLYWRNRARFERWLLRRIERRFGVR